MDMALPSALMYRQVTDQCPPAVLINALTAANAETHQKPKRPTSVLFPEILPLLDLIFVTLVSHHIEYNPL